MGCATGYIPHWLRTLGHKSTGSELTLAYRRFAEHFYGIPIPEDLEPKHRYDLISLYHVLEHLTEPDKKLAHYVSLLKDDGHMFIATPEWLDVLEEASGTPTSTFQHLFHKEHINVFTSQSIKNLFAKAGLIIEKEDHIQYGQTYLLRKDPHRETCIVKEDWQEIVDKIHRQNTAIKLYNEKKYQEAIDVWPKFPEAWLQLIFQRHGKEPEYQNELFEKAHEVIGDNCRLAQPRGIWLWQQERYQTAYEQLSWCASVRPNDDVFWFMGQCLIQLGQPKTAMAAFQRCHEMNPERWKECIAAICQLAARMPAWDERALAAMKEELAKGFKPEFKDVALEEKTATAT